MSVPFCSSSISFFKSKVFQKNLRKGKVERLGERAGFANSRAATAAFLSQVKLNQILFKRFDQI